MTTDLQLTWQAIVVIVGAVGTLSGVVLGIAKVAGILAEIKRGQTATDLALTIERDERRKVAAEAKAEVASAAAGVAQTVAFEVSQKIINGDAAQAANRGRSLHEIADAIHKIEERLATHGEKIVRLETSCGINHGNLRGATT